MLLLRLPARRLRLGLGRRMGSSRLGLGWWMGRWLGLSWIRLPGLWLRRLRFCPSGYLHVPDLYLRKISRASLLLRIHLHLANKLLFQRYD